MKRLLYAAGLTLSACTHTPPREIGGALDLPPASDSVLAAAEAALQDGQPWRAARLLEPVLRDSAKRTPERVLVAARAAAGWGGWSEVDRLLAREPWLDTQFSGMGRELLARAATARNEDSLVIRHAQLAMQAASNPHERGVRQVLLARAWDRLDSLERAAAEYAGAASLLPDVADWLRLRAAGVTRDSATRAMHYAALQTDVAKSRISWVNALARERIRDFSGAAAAYEALGARMASLRLRHTAATAAGDTSARDAVRRELLDIVTKRAGSADARLAVEMLDSSSTPLTPAEELMVGRSAAAGGPAPRAIAAFARALDSAAGATPNDRFAHASLLAGAGRYREAAAQFEKVPASSPLAGRAAYERARAALRTAGGGTARTDLEAVVERHARDTTAASSALYLLGDLAADDGRDGDARELFRRLVATYPTSTFAPSARFRAAILAFVKGNFRAAALELDTLALQRPRSSETLAALYWGGRAWSRAGDSATARTRWEDVNAREAASYYAMLAARRLRRQPWAPAIAADTLVTDSLTIAGLQRARLLRELGMDREADLEYDWLVERPERSAAAAIVAAHAFQQQDLASRAIRLGSRALSKGAPRDVHLYRALYPLAYEHALVREIERHHLDAALVAALIRQESNFDPRATSRVGARGLMQIMPAVGRQLATTQRYHTWDAALLYQPDVSLELGTIHLAGMLKNFADITHALAAYNAGSARAKRWLERAGTDDPEVYVERIPFAETRDYVRVILRNRELYRALYGW